MAIIQQRAIPGHELGHRDNLTGIEKGKSILDITHQYVVVAHYKKEQMNQGVLFFTGEGNVLQREVHSQEEVYHHSSLLTIMDVEHGGVLVYAVDGPDQG